MNIKDYETLTTFQKAVITILERILRAVEID